MLSKGFLELARKLIAADTVSSQGTQRAADLLQSLWEHAGLPVRRQVVEEIHVNLLGGPGGGTQGPGGVLLVTHLDTVPPGPRERWQTDPWTLTERDGFLHGLGVADVKLDALCKAEAARRLQGRGARRPFWLLGTFGEEVGLRGARHFIQSDLCREVPRSQGASGQHGWPRRGTAAVRRESGAQLHAAAGGQRDPESPCLGQIVGFGGGGREGRFGDQRRSGELQPGGAGAARDGPTRAPRDGLPPAAAPAGQPLARPRHRLGAGGALAADASGREGSALRSGGRGRRAQRPGERRWRGLHPTGCAPLAGPRSGRAGRGLQGAGPGVGGPARTGRARAADLGGTQCLGNVPPRRLAAGEVGGRRPGPPRARSRAARETDQHGGGSFRPRRVRGDRDRPGPQHWKRAHAQRARRNGATDEGVRSVRVPSCGALRLYVIRDAQRSDLPGLRKLASELDTVNLPDDERQLSSILEKSARSFDGRIRDPFEREYLFVMEETRTGKLVGSSLIIAQHGTRDAPHIFFDVYEKEHYSHSVDRHFRHRVLSIGYNFDGPTEIGGLVVDPEFRGQGKPGKQLSYVRFLCIAMHRPRFRDRILVELLPRLEEDGRSPLWEALGRKFTGLSYQDADRLSRENKEFIQQLFPPGEIYATLFSQKIQDAICEVGPESVGAKNMLTRIGFRYDERIDPFDGGPHYSAPTELIEPIRRFRRAKLARQRLPEGTDASGPDVEDRLVAVERGQGRNRFRAVRALCAFHDSEMRLPEAAVKTLAAEDGERLHTIPFE